MEPSKHSCTTHKQDIILIKGNVLYTVGIIKLNYVALDKIMSSLYTVIYFSTSYEWVMCGQKPKVELQFKYPPHEGSAASLMQYGLDSKLSI